MPADTVERHLDRAQPNPVPGTGKRRGFLGCTLIRVIDSYCDSHLLDTWAGCLQRRSTFNHRSHTKTRPGRNSCVQRERSGKRQSGQIHNVVTKDTRTGLVSQSHVPRFQHPFGRLAYQSGPKWGT